MRQHRLFVVDAPGGDPPHQACSPPPASKPVFSC